MQVCVCSGRCRYIFSGVTMAGRWGRGGGLILAQGQYSTEPSGGIPTKTSGRAPLSVAVRKQRRGREPCGWAEAYTCDKLCRCNFLVVHNGVCIYRRPYPQSVALQCFRKQHARQQVAHQQVCAAVILKTYRRQAKRSCSQRKYVAAGIISFYIVGYVIRLRRSTRRKEVG